ncbi:hypothetical protein Esti_000701 [Eimeria stiedai]
MISLSTDFGPFSSRKQWLSPLELRAVYAVSEPHQGLYLSTWLLQRERSRSQWFKEGKVKRRSKTALKSLVGGSGCLPPNKGGLEVLGFAREQRSVGFAGGSQCPGGIAEKNKLIVFVTLNIFYMRISHVPLEVELKVHRSGSKQRVKMAADYTQADQLTEEEETPTEVQLPRRKCANLYSEPELARNLCEYVLDCACHLGYDRDTFYSNIRIALSVLATAVGIVASVWLPYPDYKGWLMLAVIIFFSVVLALFLLDVFVMQGAATCVRDSKKRPIFIGVGIDTKKATAAFSVRRGEAQLSHSIQLGKCFDTEGFLMIDAVYLAIQSLFANFESGVTDETKTQGKKQQ